jgi:hypothetical protein
MLKIENAAGVITSITSKDAPSPAPVKDGEPLTVLHSSKLVIEIDVTNDPTIVDTLFPGADAAIKMTACTVDNKGWVQTAKTKPGPHAITVRASDGVQFEIDRSDVRGGAQLKVSSQNSKKTNTATLVIRVAGRFTTAQKQALDSLLRADVKVWLAPAQMDFSDLSGEIKAKADAKAKKKEAKKPKQESADDVRPSLRAVPA